MAEAAGCPPNNHPFFVHRKRIFTYLSTFSLGKKRPHFPISLQGRCSHMSKFQPRRGWQRFVWELAWLVSVFFHPSPLPLSCCLETWHDNRNCSRHKGPWGGLEDTRWNNAAATTPCPQPKMSMSKSVEPGINDTSKGNESSRWSAHYSSADLTIGKLSWIPQQVQIITRVVNRGRGRQKKTGQGRSSQLDITGSEDRGRGLEPGNVGRL